MQSFYEAFIKIKVNSGMNLKIRLIVRIHAGYTELPFFSSSQEEKKQKKKPNLLVTIFTLSYAEAEGWTSSNHVA